ncbi:mercuric reductase, partial [filamentous cyanobacterium Phorm 46]
MLDYDLVIIGGTAAGRYAALTATNFPARVALVEPLSNSQDLPIGGKESIDLGLRYTQILSEAARFSQQIGRQQLGVLREVANSEKPIEFRFDGVLKWAEGVVANLSEIDSLDVLAARGIDVIFGDGEFVRKPDLAFVVGDRPLRSLSYLLACPTMPAIPNIEGLSAAGFFTSETVAQLAKLPQLPQTLAVIGGDPSGVEVAQTMTRLGVAVTLVVKSSHI